MEELKGVRTITELVQRVDKSETLAAKLKEKPSDVLRAADVEIRDNSDVPNTFVYRAAVIFVGLALLLTIAGVLALLAFDGVEKAPEWAIAVTSAAIGALAGMLRA